MGLFSSKEKKFFEYVKKKKNKKVIKMLDQGIDVITLLGGTEEGLRYREKKKEEEIRAFYGCSCQSRRMRFNT